MPIPAEKIIKNTKNETKFILSPLIPGKIDTYQYDMKKQNILKCIKIVFTALTYRKTGWGCLRHYEILASGSISFLDLEKCGGYIQPYQKTT